MILPPNITARLIMLGVTTLVGTVIPFMVQDKPVIKFVFDKLGPRVVNRVQERVDQRFKVQESPRTPFKQASYIRPMRYDDGVMVEGACIDCNTSLVSSRIMNPQDLCRKHWWTGGFIRRFISFPFRVGHALCQWM